MDGLDRRELNQTIREFVWFKVLEVHHKYKVLDFLS